MARRVLTVTTRADVHADLVADRLAAAGALTFRLNFDEFPELYEVDLEFAGGRCSGCLVHLPTGERLLCTDIDAVWMRKRADFSFLSKDLGPQERAYARAETRHLLLGLLYSLDCYWMSHPLALRAASWKVEQLQRAARFGFDVPRSVATNRPERAEAFMAAEGDIVFKPLSSATLAAEQVAAADRVAPGMLTRRVGPEHADLLDSVAELPCFFQSHVAKRHELRVTVIGERVFAARIHSQDDARTATDWRDMSAEIRFEQATLPAAIEKRCLGLTHSYGLTFGALDLVVTPAGDPVFLEINPVGQFLFVQELVPELDMIGAVADCLIEGAKRREAAR